MRWPRSASSAAPVHAGFIGVTLMATISYALADPAGRTVVYALVTLVPVTTFLLALRAGHLPDRVPWGAAIGGLALLTLSHLVWPDWIPAHHLGRAEGSLTDLTMNVSHTLFLVGTGAALRRHAVHDSGGLLDAAMVGLCAGGPLWEWVIRPHLGPDASPFGQVMLLLDLLTLAGVGGCLLRIGVTAKKARGPLGYLIACDAFTLLANATAVLTVHGPSVWTAEFMMLGYLTLAAAPLHPAAPYCTLPEPTAGRATGHPHLGWLGAALCANPLIAAVQTIRGGAGSSLLLPVGTLLVIPLVLLRFQQLSAQRDRAERTLAHHASHDELTGLYNRRHIVAEIDRALDEVRQGALDGIALVLCDLDGFKPVNDRMGHQAGDLVLQTVAARLAGCLRGDDVVGRLGGDEFLILCRGAPERAVAQLIERIPRAVGTPVELAGVTVTVGVTIGSAIAGTATTLDRDALIGQADATMYAGKAGRRRLPGPGTTPRVAIETYK
ncbi:GGDEF domain-containing protein [Planosporangium thailandense]|uniref:GGDEF domain-containing protein n=1 Tax=Planosporangium thailandense TaxID=765197 RepID=A0ABX0Y5N2_9ACTN|nr:GGDEF domain-containing protein [Planosporangium thailandense]NJC72604.1 GGDEF domain-containing protein [Planosporangium thailandense]